MKKPVLKYFTVTGFILGCSIFLVNCAPVKGYQKVYLNDEEMMLSNRKIEIYESNFQSYREGAVGGNSGNSGSGCGCN